MIFSGKNVRTWTAMIFSGKNVRTWTAMIFSRTSRRFIFCLCGFDDDSESRHTNQTVNQHKADLPHLDLVKVRV